MVEMKELIRQADDLRERARHEEDPHIRDRLNRMADTYSDIAAIEAGAAPPSVHGLMDALTGAGGGRPAKSPSADDSVQAPSAATMKQTNEPWRQPVEKEQKPGRVSADALERWHRSSTH